MKLIVKKYILILPLIMLTFTSQAANIRFVANASSWSEILKLAKQSNKKIFVDVYTTWCGPCKRMDAEVFNQTAVATLFNKNFINVKVDAEKSWGIQFAKTNQVDGYPTYLFFNPDGKIVYTTKGFIPPSNFFALGEKALKFTTKQEVTNYANAYEEGTLPPDQLLKYINTVGSIPHPREELLDNYLATLSIEDCAADAVQQLIYRNAKSFQPNGQVYRALLAGYQRYPFKNGLLTSPWNTLRSRILEKVESAGKIQDMELLDALVQANQALESSRYALNRERDFMSCVYYANANDADNFKLALASFHERAIGTADTTAIYAADLHQFQAELNRLQLQPEHYKASFRSESYRTTEELLSILFFYEQNPKIQRDDITELMRISLPRALEMYRNNPVHALPFLLGRSDKAMKTIDQLIKIKTQ